MRKAILGITLTVLMTSGCCFDKVALEGNGTPATGNIGGSMTFTVCSPAQKTLAKELEKHSVWYREEWDKCEKSADATGCRTTLTAQYKTWVDAVVDALNRMGVQSDKQQQQILQETATKLGLTLQ